jgi:N-acetylmuramoyl-L-alanine amidase
MALWIEDFVTKNKFSRPAIKLLAVKGIVMHWTATNGATDENEHDFFDGADGGGGRYASAHFFIDRDSATLVIPLDEVAYHANEHPCRIDKLKATASYYQGGGANLTAIGVEMCVEKDGTIHADTIARAVDVVTELCKRYKLDPLKDIYRHFDITGKNCPAPWVTDPSKFTKFKNDVNAELHPAPKPEPKPANKKSYTVVDGDTFYKISKKTGVSVDNLTKYNPRVNPDKLQIGDVVYLVPVPASADTKPKPKATKKYVVLPKTADSWNVYPTNKAPVKANAIGKLNPKKFGGLTYEILGNPQKDVYTIKTDAFGKVNIYASKDTDAKIVEK